MAITRKKFLAIILLFSTSFAWFYVFYNFFDDLMIPTISVNTIWYDVSVLLFFVFTIISAFIGSFIAERVNRRKFLFFWIIFGILVILPIPFISVEELFPVFGALVGFSFGLGFPSCMAFIAESTNPEERGRVSGTAILVSFFLAMTFFILLPSLSLGTIGILVVLIGIKSITLLSFLLDPIDRATGEPKRWRFIFAYKDFDYYVLAFIIFSVAAGLANIVVGSLYSDPAYQQVSNLAQAIRFVGVGIFGLIAGIMADRIGRKKLILFGLSSTLDKVVWYERIGNHFSTGRHKFFKQL